MCAYNLIKNNGPIGPLFFILGLKVGEWICLCRDPELGIVNVSIDLRRIKIFMPQQLLQRPDIDAVLQHKRCRRVPKLVR